MIDCEQVTCQKCGNIIGQIIVIENNELLRAGGAIIRELRGYCSKCKEPFFYSISDRKLADLLRKVVQK